MAIPEIQQAWRNLRQCFEPDIRLENIEELTPELLRRHHVKAAFFDLDDTLMPEFSGRFTMEMIDCLVRLKKGGILLGVNTNNYRSSYCRKILGILKEEGITVPFIENAYKPRTRSFHKLLHFYGLNPPETAMVGDGILTDTLGAKRVGMVAIRVRWFSSPWKQGTPLFIRELVFAFFDAIRLFLFQHSTTYHNFVEEKRLAEEKEAPIPGIKLE